MKTSLINIIVTVLSLSLQAMHARGQASSYAAVEIPIDCPTTQLGVSSIYRLDIDNDGRVAGLVLSGTYLSDVYAYTWKSPATSISLINVPSSSDLTGSRGIAAGKVVGAWEDSSSSYLPRPFRFDTSTSTFTTLSASPNQHGEALDTNPNGRIVGYVLTNSTDYVAVYWASSTSNPTYLNSTLGYPTSAATKAIGISDNGAICGTYGVDAWKLSGTTVTTLQPYTGCTTTSYEIPSAVNNNGITVGFTDCSGSPFKRAVYWDASGNVNAIASIFSGTTGSIAYDINNSDVVVGYAETSTAEVGWVWSSSVGMKNLTSITTSLPTGWRITRAFAINADGWIACQANKSGQSCTKEFVLIPQ